jgi:hypothetical protein
LRSEVDLEDAIALVDERVFGLSGSAWGYDTRLTMFSERSADMDVLKTLRADG